MLKLTGEPSSWTQSLSFRPLYVGSGGFGFGQRAMAAMAASSKRSVMAEMARRRVIPRTLPHLQDGRQMVDVLERAQRYLAKCPVAVSGQGGHDATFHVAAVLVHGFALSQSEALMHLREWNAGCVPPWSESELEHKIVSAANAQHAEPYGHLVGDGSTSSGLRPPSPQRGEGHAKPGASHPMDEPAVASAKPKFEP